jgi:hypothetical protein
LRSCAGKSKSVSVAYAEDTTFRTERDEDPRNQASQC